MSKAWISLLLASCLAGVFLVGCASKKTKPEAKSEVVQVPRQDQLAFERGMNHLGAERYVQALEAFDQVLESNPTSEFGLVTWFNKGAALEGLGKCREATKVYRKTLRMSNKRFRRIEAQSLFRLAYTYECLGDVPKQIASLRDAMRRRKFLSNEVSEAELPARLAAAYARSGNLKTAEVYFNQAQKGLLKIHQDAGDPFRRKEMLARTLYFMGRVQPDAKRISRQSKAYIGSLKYLQAYLLKSCEMSSQEWSPRAADNLVDAYEVVWQALKTPPRFKLQSKDRAEKEMALRRWQAQLARGTMDNIQSLKALRFPDPKEPLFVQGIFKEMERQERKLDAYLANLAGSTDLTPEAKQRQGIRRDGKVKSNPTLLEKKARQRSQLPAKKKKGGH